MAKQEFSGQANDLMAKVRKKFGNESIVIPGKDDPRSQVRGVIRCGIDALDRYVLGCGGLPRGRISEIYSEPGVGKTTYVWSTIAAAQAAGASVVYCDNEHSWDNERAAVFGVDLESMLLMQPEGLEDALEQMQYTAGLVVPETPTLFVWDSLGGSNTTVDDAGDYQKQKMDPRAIKCGQFVRAITKLAGERQFHMMIVNHSKQKRGVLFGDATTTPGGDAVKFHSSIRLQLFGGKSLKDAKTNEHIGKTITFLATKTRFSPPFRKCKVRLYYATGWDHVWTTINLAKDLGKVPSGMKYTVENYAAACAQLGWEDPIKPGDVVEAEEDDTAEFSGLEEAE